MGLVCYSRMPAYARMIWYLVAAATAAQIISAIELPRPVMMGVYNTYILAELFFFVRFFNYFLSTQRSYQILRSVAIISVLSMFGWSIIRFDFFDVFFGKTVCLLFLFETAAVLLLLRIQLGSDSFAVSRRNPLLYLMAGVLLYSPVNLIFFSLRELQDFVDGSLSRPFWTFHDLTNTAMYGLYAIAFYFSAHHSSKAMVTMHAGAYHI